MCCVRNTALCLTKYTTLLSSLWWTTLNDCYLFSKLLPLTMRLLLCTYVVSTQVVNTVGYCYSPFINANLGQNSISYSRGIKKASPSLAYTYDVLRPSLLIILPTQNNKSLFTCNVQKNTAIRMRSYSIQHPTSLHVVISTWPPPSYCIFLYITRNDHTYT